jgi:protein-disulfide isomerase
MAKANILKSKALLWGLAILLLAASLAMTAPRAGLADDPAAVFDAKQSEAIETVVRQYLLAHPEVLIEALQAYEQNQKLAETAQQRAAIVAEAKAPKEDPDAPVLGNPAGDVTLVEFFDYRCPYCKRLTGEIARLIEGDSNIRLVMKEFPILSQESVQAARAALAAQRQGKYEAFHFALMENGGTMTDDEIMAVAESVGLDEAQLRSDMQDPAIEAALRNNHALAEKLNITGTPAIVLGDTLIPGAVGLDQLRAMIAEARAKAS